MTDEKIIINARISQLSIGIVIWVIMSEDDQYTIKIEHHRDGAEREKETHMECDFFKYGVNLFLSFSPCCF